MVSRILTLDLAPSLPKLLALHILSEVLRFTIILIMASKIPRALIGGNWKCNGTLAQVRDRIKVLNAAVPFAQSSEVVIATPSLHLPLCKEQFHPSINVASQDVGFKKGFGAYTGEMSAEMLVDAGIKWTLTGHSERRVGFGYPVR